MNKLKTTPCPTCKGPCLTTVNIRGGDYGWGTSDAERTVYRYAAPEQSATKSWILKAIVEIDGVETEDDNNCLSAARAALENAYREIK